MVELAIEARAWRAATLDQLGLDRLASDERAIVQQWAEQSRRPFFLALASMMAIAEHLRHGRLHAAEAALADLPSGVDTGPELLRRLRRPAVPPPAAAGTRGRVHPAVRPARRRPHRPRRVARRPRSSPSPRPVTPAAGDLLRDAVAASRRSSPTTGCGWRRSPSSPTPASTWVTRAPPPSCYRRLSPHRDHTVIIAHGIASLGPVAARLAALRRLASGAATSLSPSGRLSRRAAVA